MTDPEPHEITLWLRNWANGDKSAFDQLMPVVYRELRRLASGYLRNERSPHTLQPTALIHEAYLRLVDQSVPEFRSRAQFYGVAAHVMRQILVDNARVFRSQKHGAGNAAGWEALPGLAAPDNPDIVEVDDALQELERLDQRKARAIEMQYFGGLTVEEIASALDSSPRTVAREIRSAKAWLLRELARRRSPGRRPPAST